MKEDSFELFSSLPATSPSKKSHVSTPPTPTDYFAGLAAGSDAADLIKGLRFSMAASYQESMGYSVEKDDLLPTAQRQLEDRCSAASLHRNRSQGSSIKAKEAPIQNKSTADTALSSSPSSSPPLLPSLPPDQRRALWTAAKYAMLFSTECPAAAAEATKLHYSPITRLLLWPHYYPNAAATAAEAPYSSALMRGDLQWILSDVQAIQLARAEMRREAEAAASVSYPSSTVFSKKSERSYDRDSRGVAEPAWMRALALVRQVEQTPLTAAFQLDVYRRTAGCHWMSAIQALQCIPVHRWTEMDVSSVLRQLYRTAKTKRQKDVRYNPDAVTTTASVEAAPPPSADESDVWVSAIVTKAMHILNTAHQSQKWRWSVPSALNDCLGLLALHRGGWIHACALLEDLWPDKEAPFHEAVSSAVVPSTTTTVGSASLLEVSPPGSAGIRSSVCENCSETSVSRHTNKSQAVAPCNGSMQLSAPVSRLHYFRGVQPNSATIGQICQVFGAGQWGLGLYYTRQLMEKYRDSCSISMDDLAAERVLSLCIAGDQWQCAMDLLQRYYLFPGSAAYSTTDGMRQQRHIKVSIAGKTPLITLALRPHRTELFLQLIQLLGQHRAAQPLAYQLVQQYSGGLHQLPHLPPPPQQQRRGSSASSLPSKFFNRNTLSRAYNTLIQLSGHTAEAEALVAQLNAVVGSGSPSLPSLEAESVAHYALLLSADGQWEAALRHAYQLLHHPSYHLAYVPTARLHDAVQYAISEAPAPGPPWIVSLQLFYAMHDRQVQFSEVAFQSVIKRCFSGGVPDQAQKLFHFVMRNGVRP